MGAERQDQEEDGHRRHAAPSGPIGPQCAEQGQRQSRHPGEQGHLPQVAAAPVGKGRHVAEKAGRDQGDQVLGGKGKGCGEGVGDPHAPHAFGGGVDAAQDLHRAEGGPAGVERGEAGDGLQAGVAPQEPQGQVDRSRHACVVDILRMAGEDLHADGGASGKKGRKPPFFGQAVHGEEDQRGPGHRAEVRQVTGVDVKEDRARKHAENRRRQAGHGVKAAGRNPQMEEETEQEDVQGHNGIDGLPQGQDQEQQVGRVEQGRLEPAEKGSAGKQVGVPERQVTRPQLVDGELPPVEELVGDVGAGLGEDAFAGPEEHVGEHHQRHGCQDQRRPLPGQGRPIRRIAFSK
ncbi:MAG: hypothetical protein A4E73_01298 [Syntrophaceae bacterium PtaU1.Bin231]|nr:MAG: hypothetical protein A4E73_01298 [Syntrophaceae bacterium PtaU1.Bin231]